jgi:hypothetical protein
MRYSHKMFIILCLSGTAFVMPAMAEDEVPAAAQAFLDNLERQTTVEPTYESLDEDDDGTVTIKNLAVVKAAEGGQPGVNMKIGEIVLSDLTDEGDGLYQIGNAKFTDMSGDIAATNMAMTFTVPEAGAEGWYVAEASDAPTPEAEFRASMNIARKMTGGKMTITAMGQTFSVDGYESTWDGDPKTGAGSFTMKISNIAIPEAAIAMMDQGGMLKQLGYSGLNFDMNSDGKLTIADGNMGLDVNVGLAGKDIATVRFGIGANDVPLAVYAEIQKAQKAGTQPDFNALMPQVQNITFSGFSVRFEDQSITKKVLPMIAAMQGMDEAGLIASAGPMLQMGLMQLQNEAFAKQTAEAVNNFLKDPKSLTVSAKPAAPVKVSDLMTLNPAAPGEAITKLGVSVTAND